jgi:flagellar biosynthetic protein FliR
MLSSEMIKMMKPAGFIILIISLESIGGRIEWLWVQGFSVVRDVIGVPRG